MKLKITATLFLIVSICFAATANQAVALKYSWVEEICPLDGTKFKAKLAMSGTQLGVRLDFKPLGPIAAPWPVAVCPTDHFVLYKSKFDQSEISKLQEFVNSPAYQKHVLDNSSYYLMAKIFEFIEKPSEQIAYTYLKASWQVERDDPQKYSHYVSKSLEYFEKCIAQLKQQGRKSLSTEVLCAELERRLALFDNAGKRLTRVKEQFKVDKRTFGRIITYEMKLIKAKDSDPHERPDFPEKIDAYTFNSRGGRFYRRGQYDTAIENYDKAIRLKPDFAEAFLNRGAAYIGKGLYDRAIDDLDNAIRLKSNDADALYTRGQSNFYLGFFAKAARDFEQALKLYSSDIFCTIWLFIARERSGQNGEQELARNVVKFDLKNWPGPVVSLFLGKATPQQVLASVKHSDQRKQRELECEAFFYVGQHYLLRGNRDEAARLFRKTLNTGIHQFTEYTGAKSELDRLESESYRNELENLNQAIRLNSHHYESYLKRGYIYLSMKKYQQAIEDFNKAIALNPRAAEEIKPKYRYAYMTRGKIYKRKGQHDKAIADFSKALEIDPRYFQAYITRGGIYTLKGQHDKAIVDFSKALEIHPKYFQGYMTRGGIYLNKRLYDKAIVDFSKAIELKPKSVDAYTRRGHIYRYKGQHDKAIADFSKVIEIKPKSCYAYNNRGENYVGKGRHDKAIADFSKAIEIKPRYAEAYYNRGRVYDGKGRYDKAISDYNKAIEINPRYAKAYNNRGLAYKAKKNIKKACSDWQKACQLFDCSNWGFANKIRCLGK